MTGPNLSNAALGQYPNVEAEIKAFEKDRELPKSVPVKSYEDQVRTARVHLEEAYKGAVAQYTKDGKIALAKAVRQELEDFKKGGSGSTESGLGNDLLMKLAKAREDYDKAIENCKTELLKQFDDAINLLAKQTGASETRARRLELIRAEKERFEKGGLIPWTLEMRIPLAGYQKNTALAAASLRKSYEKAIEQAQRAKNAMQVSQLRADLAAALDVKVVATWNHAPAHRPAGAHIQLYSNGRVGAPDGSGTWSFQNGVLTLRSPPVPTAPGGAWVDTCPVAPDGQTYSGKSQVGVRINGTYVTKP